MLNLKESLQNITDRIKNLIKETNVSNYKVCRECGIRDSHFSEVLRFYPKRNFTVEQVKNLSIFFGVTTDWLILGNTNGNVKDKDIQVLKTENLNLKNENKQLRKLESAVKKFKILIANLDNEGKKNYKEQAIKHKLIL